MAHTQTITTAASRPPIKSSGLTPLLGPLQAFLSAESSGGVVLMAAAVTAIVWANSPWGDAYHQLWHAKLSIGLGPRTVALSLEHWVNDGLMAIFFLLVGLEIKRELMIGELRSPDRAALPIAAAAGGMVVPGLAYAALNHGTPGAAGWAIPLATDIAFAVGVLSLAARSAPSSLKVFLLAVAIVDDLGAVLLIALFYTAHISWVALGVAGLLLLGLIALNLLSVHRPLPYAVLGIALWAATLASGLHATIAGVLLAFTIPATRRIEERPFVHYVRGLLVDFDREADAAPDHLTHDQSHAIKSMEEVSQAVQTPLARIEHALLMPVNFLVIPVFALANAGVDLRHGGAAAATSPVAWGVFLGLLAGKPLGILAPSGMLIKSGLAARPAGAASRHVTGAAFLCGIGFTMSLFIASLAFPDQEPLIAAAKLGILAASACAGVVGAAVMGFGRGERRAPIQVLGSA